MKSILSTLILCSLLINCSTRDKYDVALYHNRAEQDSVLTSIIAYIYTAPVYTLMKDRLMPAHRAYYSSLTPKFSFYRYFIAEDGTNYFYVIRPAPKIGDHRAVGGHFKMDSHHQLNGFREVFVTPILPDEELKNRCAFLFDEMVKGTIDPYLKMKTYVQWPDEVTAYDTVTYEWKLIPEKIQ